MYWTQWLAAAAAAADDDDDDWHRHLTLADAVHWQKYLPLLQYTPCHKIRLSSNFVETLFM